MFQWIKDILTEKARKQNWIAERLHLEKFEADLISLGEFPQKEEDAFDYAVNFFNVVSPIQDAGGFHNAPSKVGKEQGMLNKLIWIAGRDKSGNNRTGEGEPADLVNTYWGGVFGLWTFKGITWKTADGIYQDFAAKWLKNPEGYETDPTERKVIVDFQVRPFVEKKRREMLKLCNEILAE